MTTPSSSKNPSFDSPASCESEACSTHDSHRHQDECGAPDECCSSEHHCHGHECCRIKSFIFHNPLLSFGGLFLIGMAVGSWLTRRSEDRPCPVRKWLSDTCQSWSSGCHLDDLADAKAHAQECCSSQAKKLSHHARQLLKKVAS